MNKKNYIQSQYNSFHDSYSRSFSIQNELSNRVFHSAIDFDLRSKEVLDIGCGDGSDLQILAGRGAVVYGLDPSDKFLEKAAEKTPSGTFCKGIGEDLPFPENFFDIVVSKWALQTSPDVPKVLLEAARVLKSGGRLVLLTKHPWIQWLEKVRDFGHGADYYEQMIVTSKIYSGSIELKEPTHTLGEYFSREFLSLFVLEEFIEYTDFPASEQIGGDIYPTFFLIKATRK